MAEEPIFYCENCGSVVAKGDSRCKKCGKSFDGVKCPRCDYQGTTSEFKNGCPNCHFKLGDDINITKPRPKAYKYVTPFLSLVFVCAIVLIFALYNFVA